MGSILEMAPTGATAHMRRHGVRTDIEDDPAAADLGELEADDGEKGGAATARAVELDVMHAAA